MRLLIVTISILILTALLPSGCTIYEDGSYLTYTGQAVCIPFQICAEGE